jgi:RNA polymerase sigma-70 factor (ECF subfamily)
MPERNPSPLFLVPPVGRGRPLARGDVEMVAAYLAGERWAAEAIWERHAPQVRRMVMRALGPGPGAEDLVQDAFLRLYRKLPQLRDGAALPAFVVTITTRVVQTELRARWFRRWLGLAPGGKLPETMGEAVDLDAREALARFYRLLDELLPKYRTVFVLRHIEGMELTDVAAATGVSLATIKRWLPRILERIHRRASGDPLLQRYVRSTSERHV